MNGFINYNFIVNSALASKYKNFISMAVYGILGYFTIIFVAPTKIYLNSMVIASLAYLAYKYYR